LSRLTLRIRRHLPGWTADWLRDSSLLLTFQFLATVSTSVLAIILARALGPSSWGLFSGLLALSLAVATLVEFGLATWLLREISELRANTTSHEGYRDRASRPIVGALAATGTLGVVLITGSIAGLALAHARVETGVTLVCLLIYTISVTTAVCIEAYVRAERKLGVVGLATGLEKVVLVIAAGGLALLGFGTPAIALGFLTAGVLRLTYEGTIVFGRERVPLRKPKVEDIWRYFVFGLPFAFNTVALTVIPRLDTFLIALVSKSAAGFFAIGDRILGPATILPVVASRALYPFLVREAHDSRTPWLIASGLFAAGALMAGIGAILAPTIVPIVFGAAYEEAVGVVQLMLMAVPFVFASNALLVRLYVLRLERAVFGVTLVSSLLGTGALVLGQLAIGPMGAAGGYVLRQVLFATALTVTGLIASSTANRRPALDSSAEGDRPMVGRDNGMTAENRAIAEGGDRPN
jgi:O-antigen/teichoic acid export membrane protein